MNWPIHSRRPSPWSESNPVLLPLSPFNSFGEKNYSGPATAVVTGSPTVYLLSVKHFFPSKDRVEYPLCSCFPLAKIMTVFSWKAWRLHRRSYFHRHGAGQWITRFPSSPSLGKTFSVIPNMNETGGTTIAGLATHLSSSLVGINKSSNLTFSTRTIAKSHWHTRNRPDQGRNLTRPSMKNEERKNESKLPFFDQENKPPGPYLSS